MNLKSKVQAKKVIEKLFPKKVARGAYLGMFKEAIAEARRHGEEKWGVSLHDDRVRLIIGHHVVCTLHEGSIWFVLPGEDYPDYTSPKEIPGWDTESYKYKSISSITGYYQYSRNYHKTAWPQIRKQHFKFLELVAPKFKKLHSKSLTKHSPGVLKYLDTPDRGEPPPPPPPPNDIKKQFKSLIQDITLLKQDPTHTEKAHEALVVSFYEALGYKKFIEIKYELDNIDIAIQVKKKIIIANEVKRDWNLSNNMSDARDQVYRYALRSGTRLAVVTNGDYYAVYDRDKGRSYKENFIGDFNLSERTEEKLKLIKILMKK